MLSAKSMTSATLTIIEKFGGDMFKDMKIPVENNLDEIMAELEKKGYKKRKFAVFKDEIGSYVVTRKYGIITWCDKALIDLLWSECKLTTLAKLKEM